MEHTEIQRCPRKLYWVLIVIGILTTGFVLSTTSLLAYDSGTGEELVWIPATIVVSIIGSLVLLFHFSRLHVRINAIGIHVQFSPFQLKGRLLPWNEITSVTLRRVSPFAEFGGWGIRWNLGKRMGYVWNGENGIELKLTNGKIVVITIHDLDGARLALNTYVTAGNTTVTFQDRSIT
ncbi:MAG: hypothetical protein H7X70_06015 [Candidatus Kapabacteria bacterium]|nr:hypothetical protein [Candidatus Kapabacteria bacterium]